MFCSFPLHVRVTMENTRMVTSLWWHHCPSSCHYISSSESFLCRGKFNNIIIIIPCAIRSNSFSHNQRTVSGEIYILKQINLLGNSQQSRIMKMAINLIFTILISLSLEPQSLYHCIVDKNHFCFCSKCFVQFAFCKPGVWLDNSGQRHFKFYKQNIICR